TNKIKELIFIPIFGGSPCDNLLGQDIQRFFGNDEAIELPTTYAMKQCRALHQFITAQGEDAALRQTTVFACLPEPWRRLVLSASDALQKAGDGSRGTKLANQIDGTDIDA